ncbi:MAG TPA: hypothetical protein VFM73_02545 [Xanthomonadaceae bacterium]|nr:hypothetical protein [Xanthomonadaceae bacterium]
MNATAMHDTPRPAWFTIAAIAALLWNLLGIAMFTLHYTMSPEGLAQLPAEQQALFEATPAWVWVAYGVAVFAGGLGSLMLVLRRRVATWFLLLSLLAVAAQFAWQAYLSQAVALLGVAGALGLPLFILVVAVLVYGFARHAAARGWLR